MAEPAPPPGAAIVLDDVPGEASAAAVALGLTAGPESGLADGLGLTAGALVAAGFFSASWVADAVLAGRSVRNPTTASTTTTNRAVSQIRILRRPRPAGAA